MQSITAQKGNEKMVKCNDFYVFDMKFNFTLAIAAWPTLIDRFCPHPILTLVLPPSSYRKFAQFRNTRTQGEILLNFIFST
jgi:hypothetical protein